MASRTGDNLFSSNLDRTKWSISPLGQALSLTGGVFGLTGGMNDQNLRPASRSILLLTGLPPLTTRGSGAPILIHSAKLAATCRDSLSRGGIFSLPTWRIACSSRLSAGLPGTITGPDSPPLSMPCFESRNSSPLRLRASAE